MMLNMFQVSDLERISTNDQFTIAGILVVGIVSLAGVVIFMYRDNNKKDKDYIQLLKDHNKDIVDVNDSYKKSIDEMTNAITFLQELIKQRK